MHDSIKTKLYWPRSVQRVFSKRQINNKIYFLKFKGLPNFQWLLEILKYLEALQSQPSTDTIWG